LRKVWLLLELSLEAGALCRESSSIFVKTRYMMIG
jgi:hypothetical protein